MPIPWMNSIGSLVLEVWGRCQYVRCLTGDSYPETSANGRKGKSLTEHVREVRWKWNRLYTSEQNVIVSTTETHCEKIQSAYST
jgi:hypothetical protein